MTEVVAVATTILFNITRIDTEKKNVEEWRGLVMYVTVYDID